MRSLCTQCGLWTNAFIERIDSNNIKVTCAAEGCHQTWNEDIKTERRWFDS